MTLDKNKLGKSYQINKSLGQASFKTIKSYDSEYMEHSDEVEDKSLVVIKNKKNN